MKKKGFTLIELLAVIVVLAIIALIAVPMVLNTIEEARKGSAKASAYTYISEVEKYMVASQLDSSKVKLEIGKSYSVNSAGENGIVLNDIIDIKGDKPTSGTITIGEDNTVERATLTVNNYELECENQTCEVVGTKEEEPKDETDDDVVLTGDPILDKAKALVYAEDGETCKIDADASDTTTYKYMDGCYIKGNSTNNYVWYNGFMWRIMGINSDNTVRLITDENVTTLTYGEGNTVLAYTANEGYIHNWLNEYFLPKLNSTKSIIKEGAYFCNETINGKMLTEWRTSCSEDNVVSAKIGLIAIDEYVLSYTNNSTYLNIGQDYWTMTPFNSTYICGIIDNNYYNKYAPSESLYGVRPVINVESDAVITSGTGTTGDFYILNENKTTEVVDKKIDIVSVGEYVLLEDYTYRVVSKENGIKLILEGFYKTKTDGSAEETVYLTKGTTANFSTTSGIGQILNNDVLQWLKLGDSTKIKSSKWYLGNGISSNITSEEMNYINFLNKTSEVEAKVGLIQMADILASQSTTMLTSKYTTTSNQNNVSNYLTMNKTASAVSNANGWGITISGYGQDGKTENAIRPVIVVRDDLDITGGTGTWKQPYEI